MATSSASSLNTNATNVSSHSKPTTHPLVILFSLLLVAGIVVLIIYMVKPSLFLGTQTTPTPTVTVAVGQSPPTTLAMTSSPTTMTPLSSLAPSSAVNTSSISPSPSTPTSTPTMLPILSSTVCSLQNIFSNTFLTAMGSNTLSQSSTPQTQWVFNYVPGTTNVYTIMNTNTTPNNTYLIMAGTSPSSASPGLWNACSTSSPQFTNGQCQWIVQQVGSNVYTLQSVFSQTYLIMAGTSSSSANPGSWNACSTSSPQFTNGQCQWIVTF